MALLTSAEGNGTTGSFDSTGATLLIAFVSGGFSATLTVSDNKSNTWTALTAVQNYIGVGAKVQIFYSTGANLTSVGTGHTITTAAGSSAYVFCEAHDGSWTYEAESTADDGGSTGTTVNAGTLTPTTDGSLIVAGCNMINGSSALTADSPLSVSQYEPGDGATYYGGGMASGIQTTAASITPNFDWTTSKVGITGVMAVFAHSGGGGGGSTVVPSILAPKQSIAFASVARRFV